MRRIIQLLIFWVFCFKLIAQNNNLPLQVVPGVQSWHPQQGKFVLSETSKICVSKKDYSRLVNQLDIFKNDVQAALIFKCYAR